MNLKTTKDEENTGHLGLQHPIPDPNEYSWIRKVILKNNRNVLIEKSSKLRSGQQIIY